MGCKRSTRVTRKWLNHISCQGSLLLHTCQSREYVLVTQVMDCKLVRDHQTQQPRGLAYVWYATRAQVRTSCHKAHYPPQQTCTRTCGCLTLENQGKTLHLCCS